MADKRVIEDQFKRDDAKRNEILERAREVVALAKPWLLPPDGFDNNGKLPTPFQSLGSRGMTNLEGRMLLATFPPNTPWFRRMLAPEVQHDPTISDEDKQAVQQQLYLHELIVLGVLESASITGTNAKRGQVAGFRTMKRMALSQILGTGDVLEQLTDDYRLKVFRRDQYVTKRDSSCNVLYHIIKETLDPLSQSDEVLAKAELNPTELEKKDVSERMMSLFTRVQWHPRKEAWVIEQELNGVIVVESEEPVSPFFATAFELAPGDDYGRGWLELNQGDLTSLDGLSEGALDYGAMVSRFLAVLDEGSVIDDKDLAAPSGSVIRGRVAGGKVQDAGMLTVDKAGDYSVLADVMQRVETRLGKAMLLDSEVQPQQERVTAAQVQRIAQELDGALGGLYAPIADEQQVPLLNRTIWQLERDGILPALPDGSTKVEALTGIAALGREIERQRVMSYVSAVAQLGEQALQRIDMGVLTDVLARYFSITEPGLVKDKQQVQAETQAAMQQQMQMQAQQQAIQSAGNIAEQSIAQ